MKLSELNFRAMLQRFVLIPMDDSIRELINYLPNPQEIDGLLTYLYYDRDRGLTFEVLSPVSIEDKRVELLPEITECTIKIRKETLGDCDVMLFGNEELYERFEDRIAMIDEAYGVNDEIAFTRSIDLLDDVRNSTYIDDVMVYVLKDGFEMEGCWVRIDGIAETYLYGTLLNEPNQNMGVHEGDKLPFVLAIDRNNNNVCISNLDNNTKEYEQLN